MIFNKAKECRNAVAHEITSMLSEGLPDDFVDRFGEMINLLNKIELWWIINYELEFNTEVANNEIDYDGIVPGPIASIQMMVNIALGSDDEARAYYDEFMKNIQSPNVY